MEFKRCRRLRQNAVIRDMVAQTRLDARQFMMPYFVRSGENAAEEIPSMPGIYRYSVDKLLPQIARAVEAGVSAFLLFGVVEDTQKDASGSESWNPQGPVQCAIRELKRAFPQAVVAADICLCEYTNHGHCGVVKNGKILNDETLPLLEKAALSCAQAGADIIAPSDMMDGRVKSIRQALDTAGYHDVILMSYSAKYASAFYGPFREAAGSAPEFGDRKTYQMDYRNAREAVMEALADIEEGADIVMVKPGLAYLDILSAVRQEALCPVAVYQVSGEYSMIKAAARKAWIEEKKIVLEALTAMKRAGADIIITYYAVDAALWLKEGN